MVDPSVESADGPQVLLELRSGACPERVMPAVVRAGSDLVDQQRGVRQYKHFHSHHTTVVEGQGDISSQSHSTLGNLLGKAGGRLSCMQDMVAMHIFCNGIDRYFALRVARQNDRNFFVKGDKRFQYCRPITSRLSQALARSAGRSTTTWPLPS